MDFRREVLAKHARIITQISVDFLDAALNQLSSTSSYDTLGSVVSTVAASVATLYKVAQGDSTQPENKDLMNVVEQVFKTAIEKLVSWLRSNLRIELFDGYNVLTDEFELNVCQI
ncbi:hypothetical protein NP493_621g02042 [Ridgeia piscesae]|uniref:Uncharacterized protein n=1 Tax=Ridgeia piscesae TaxID=27915 RepID=A0AAD9KTJ4_RIDPI|nr:hypothetical protein NP493_621g02042 [Ridgeia piscesae]